MKKITTILILLFITFNCFAEPKIPIVDNYFNATENDYSGKNNYCYLNDSCTNMYKIFAEVKDNNYSINISNTSLITNIKIVLSLDFSTKEMFDKYMTAIDVTNLDKSFNTIRRTLIQSNVTPIYFTDDNNYPTKVLYMASN